MTDDERRAAELLAAARNVVVFTGAGVSAESGVPTFRGAGGLWKQFRPEDLATPHAFARDPRLVWEWYDWRRGLVAKCKPNAAHHAIAAAQRASGQTDKRTVTLVTQNVDDLHERAGSQDIVKLHGSLFLDQCAQCAQGAQSAQVAHRCGNCGGWLRPGVVWFGEALPEGQIEAAVEAARECQVCFVIGTSGAVYSAAGIVHEAQAAGAKVIVVDPGDTAYDSIADIRLRGSAVTIVPGILRDG